MKEDFLFLSKLYLDIYYWIADVTPGEKNYISFFKKYNIDVWEKIKNKFIELETKENLTDIEKMFLKCKYKGPAYRILNVSLKQKGYVYDINLYQSCSKTIDGVKKVKICGEKILIQLDVTEKSYAIDIFELLSFMVIYELINQYDTNYQNVCSLIRYEEEEEVIVPINRKTIKNISIVDFAKNIDKEIEKNMWFRSTL